MTEITHDIAVKVLTIVDAGLSDGLGKPIPGQMCVEAAVCFALGLPHGDDPKCVSPALRSLKITLNDKCWSSNVGRAKGLRRLAVAQLGSAGVLSDKEFVRRVAEYAIRTTAPRALRVAASIQKDAEHRAALIAAANKCEAEGTRESALEARITAYAYADAAAISAAYAASAYAAAASAADADAEAAVASAASAAAASAAAASAAYASAYAVSAKRDEELSIFAEGIVQILIAMNAPGCQWLALTESMS